MDEKELLALKKRVEDSQKLREKIQESKKNAQLGLYLNTNFVFSLADKGITDMVLTAVRGIGKTVIAVETALILKEKWGYENVKFYYFRLTDLSIKSLLANKAAKAIDPYLIHKYNLEITVKGNIVYNRGKELVEFMPLVSAGSKGKGVNLYDCEWWDKPGGTRRYIVTCWDEFMQEDTKRTSGDPVSQYRMYREAIYRDAELPSWYSGAVVNFLLANNVSECASVTGALYNFIPNPQEHRRIFLTRKHAMFWNVPITEEYKEKRKRSINSSIMDYKNDPNYTDISKDLSLIKDPNVQLIRPTNLIKFDRINKQKWFVVWDGNIIKQYNGETLSPYITISMKRYLDELYNPQTAKSIIECFDARGFMYNDLMSFSLFQAQLQLIKNATN